jgi:TfoX N-terminal domain
MAYDEQLAARIRSYLATELGVREMRMFGGLAFLINGNMAVAASGQGGLLLRVDPAQTEALIAEPRAEPFVMRGRAMDGWLRVEADAGISDAELQRWIDIGVDYAESLPPK